MADESGKDNQILPSHNVSNRKDQGEEKKAYFDTIRLIDQSIKKRIITPQFADLLKSIRTSTFGFPEAHTLKKVQAAIQLKDKLITDEANQKIVAYIGSGRDWQFPVALGARNIDMVDAIFSSDDSVLNLLESIKEHDANAELIPGEIKEIHFGIDIGKGSEKVIVRLHPSDVMEYEPNHLLYGVLEYLGPSKTYLGETSSVTPNIARKVSQGGFILNFDFNDANLRLSPSQDSGVEKMGFGDFSFLKVVDIGHLVQQAERSFQNKKVMWESMPTSTP